jgi:hypothetical protein
LATSKRQQVGSGPGSAGGFLPYGSASLSGPPTKTEGRTTVEKPKVNLEDEKVMWKGRVYEFNSRTTKENSRCDFWVESRKRFEDVHGHGKPIIIDDPEEAAFVPEGYEPILIEVKKPAKLKFLNEAVNQAKAEQRERREQLSNADSSDPEHNPRGKEKKRVKNPSVSVALKSTKSDFALNLRAAPSKKHEGLYNFSVHIGSKFCGYVEVPLEEIRELGRKLQTLGKEKKEA